MELFRSEYYYIFVAKESSLWWNRLNGEFVVKSAWDLAGLEDIECLGITQGIIGKVEHPGVYEPRLIIINETVPIGDLYFRHTIFKIKSICFLSMGTVVDVIDLPPCPKHSTPNVGIERKILPKKPGTRLFENSTFINKTIGAVKSAGSTIKNTTQQAATQVKHTVNKKRDPKLAERFEKRITDELHKIFDDTDSFYYSRTLDLTNTLQRQYYVEEKIVAETKCKCENILDFNHFWKYVDDRFFWNKHMLKDIIELEVWNFWKYVDDRFFWNKHMLKDIIELETPQCHPWVLPIIQGYMQLMQCPVDMSDTSSYLNTESLSGNSSNSCDEIYTIALISRRSRYRAGTRYNRRGIEPNGKVANYVETEQIVSIACKDSLHRASFTQVRGSVPIYWSQPCHKFRPPPRLDKDEGESQIAFRKHFEEELSIYGPVCVVNLVEQQGKEKVIWDAFGLHVLKYDSPDLIYATFDFHEYCRGMRYENVSILINALAEVIADMKFCWRDERGLICEQTSVFRINCIDCLDRTNVVQTAIAKSVLEMQLSRLGLASPGASPPALRAAFLTAWADNGDRLSRQYAGTNALKGDFTRTGERNFTGMMKDGMNSANRFFIQNFADTMRQCAIDIALGNQLDESVNENCDDVYEILKAIGMIFTENTDLIPHRPRFAIMPAYYGHTLTNEFIIIELCYGIGRYYLSRFKDAFRQVAIDMMTGDRESIPEELLRHSAAPGELRNLEADSEEDVQAMAQHVKALIDDCKRMLVCENEPVLGSWGLIDADPSTGDPNETDMDCVLILTHQNYFVADYDDQSDRITGFQTVPLADLTYIEFGVMESQNQALSLIKSNLSGRRSGSSAYRLRINYRVNNSEGYAHTFRSTGLRFFNNMAIAVNTDEEVMESLRTICESFVAAREVNGLPKLPFMDGMKMERRKSKTMKLYLLHLKIASSPHPSLTNVSGRSRNALYLDLSRLPALTRNVSEAQLVTDIKNAGSKALSNMSSQLSKLNRLGHSLQRSRPLPPPLPLHTLRGPTHTNQVFFLGQNRSTQTNVKARKKGSMSDGMSSDYSSDDESRVNIFEPTLDNQEHLSHYIGKQTTLEQPQTSELDSDAYLIENPLYMSKIESQPDEITDDGLFTSNDVNFVNDDSFAKQTPPLKPKRNPFDSCELRSMTPEIKINRDEAENVDIETTKPVPPSNLILTQKLSRSSFEVNCQSCQRSSDGTNSYLDGNLLTRSCSNCDISLNISQSQSESALKEMKLSGASPVTMVTKDFVLSPFSKLAKGMQSLGANLDPRKIKPGPSVVRQVTEQQYEEHRQLQEKWKDCKTRLIAL